MVQFSCQFPAKQIAEGLYNWKGLNLSLWWQACCSSNQGFTAPLKKNLPIVTNVKCLFDMKPLPIKMSQKYDSFTEDSFLSAEQFSAHHLGQIQMWNHGTWRKQTVKSLV